MDWFFNNLSLRHKVKCLLILASMLSGSLHLSGKQALRTIVWKSAGRGGCIRQKGGPPGQAGPTGSLVQILGEARRGRPRLLPGGLRDSRKPWPPAAGLENRTPVCRGRPFRTGGFQLPFKSELRLQARGFIGSLSDEDTGSTALPHEGRAFLTPRGTGRFTPRADAAPGQGQTLSWASQVVQY